MPSMRPLDPAFPIERQIAIEASSVVLVNVFTLDRADEQIFLQAWQDDARFMKRRPGFISTQLHRAVGGAGPVGHGVPDSGGRVCAIDPGPQAGEDFSAVRGPRPR